MAAALDVFAEGIDGVSTGLFGRGNTPITRFFGAGILTAAVLYAAKPAFAFDAHGKPRTDVKGRSALVGVPLAVGAAFAVFI